MTQTRQVNEHPGLAQLTAFIDGELSPAEAREIQQHLTDCHPCALHVLSITQLKAAIGRAAARFAPPPEALGRLAARLRPQGPKKTSRLLSFRTWTWSAAAAAIVCAASLFGLWQIRQANSLTAELLDQHLTILSTGAVPEVISTDRHTVKPWFQGKLPFSFNIPETLPADTTLKGGDLTFLRGQPAALLLFSIHKHEVSVFFTQRSWNTTTAVLPGNQSGFSIKHAGTHDLLITAVSDVNPTELDLLVSALVNAQSPH